MFRNFVHLYNILNVVLIISFLAALKADQERERGRKKRNKKDGIKDVNSLLYSKITSAMPRNFVYSVSHLHLYIFILIVLYKGFGVRKVMKCIFCVSEAFKFLHMKAYALARKKCILIQCLRLNLK